MSETFRALLVDDEETILRLFGTLLERESFSVTKATSAGEACEVMHDDSFDVIVTDLRMETKLAGFDVVNAASRLQPRPVIALLTAFPLPAAQWREAGIDALFVKGENIRSLAGKLRSLLLDRQQSLKVRLPA